MATSKGVLLLVQLMLLLVASESAAKTIPKTADLDNLNCTSRCGNVTIPYPFGVEPKCYLDEEFVVTCEDSVPLWGNMRLLNVSLEEGEIRVMNRIARTCYNLNGSKANDNFNSIFELNKFSISSTKNKFTAMGCDTVGIIDVSNKNNQTLATGCVSRCSNISYVRNGTCLGIGCCQTSIPEGASNKTIYLQSYEQHREVWNFNPCSYAFIVEEGAFDFSLSYLGGWKEESMPAVLDWAIVNMTCENAQRDLSSYACGEKTACINRKDGLGYICNCAMGYQGNPYLSDGCLDIDECKNRSLNTCVSKSECINGQGNYTCRCPKGYQGDGRIDGSRCIADRFPVQIVIGFCVASIVGALLLLIAAWWLYKAIKKRNDMKRKKKFFQQNGFLLQVSSSDDSIEKIKLFDSNELEKATDHYNENRVLGKGGQGTVYKGMLLDGRIVAVKKSKIVEDGKIDVAVEERNIEHFINEVVILSQINHRNIVKLLGCCLETEVPLLVYEFISNGTLFQLIHDPNEEFPFSWEARLRIAIEVAGALCYLHCAASIPIYHRDIKSTNILLDNKYKAKVADFGTSRSVAIDQTHLTTLVQGTFGYLDPEYFQSSQFTDKSDVYSFGVVIVELLTREKPISTTRSMESRSLATYFIQAMDENGLLEILDPQILKEDGRRDEMIAVAHLARRCLNLNGRKRPTMRDVAIELEGIKMLSQGVSTAPPNFDTSDHLGEWDALNTSMSTFYVSCKATPSDVQPLLLNKP